MSTINETNKISAKIVADSIGPYGDRLTTLEVVMPRYILAEFNTHRVLSKNSASSRAIPFEKMVKNVQENPFIPYAWQKDHKGMQGNEYFNNEKANEVYQTTKWIDGYKAIELHKNNWLIARDEAINIAKELNEAKVTKQLCNRLLEPFMYHKVLVSGTEWENFFNLRCPQYTLYSADKEVQTIDYKSWKELCKHYFVEEDVSTLHKLQHNKGQADIHMMFLAEAIYDAIQESTPKQLKEGEWHIPYGDNMDMTILADVIHKTSGSFSITLEEAKRKISVARCARLSYQTLGDNPIIDYEADLKLYDTLASSGHYSPFEHVAKVMTSDEYSHYAHSYPTLKAYEHEGKRIEAGKDCQFDEGWCRNFKGFIQERVYLEQNG